MIELSANRYASDMHLIGRPLRIIDGCRRFICYVPETVPNNLIIRTVGSYRVETVYHTIADLLNAYFLSVKVRGGDGARNGNVRLPSLRDELFARTF